MNRASVGYAPRKASATVEQTGASPAQELVGAKAPPVGGSSPEGYVDFYGYHVLAEGGYLAG